MMKFKFLKSVLLLGYAIGVILLLNLVHETIVTELGWLYLFLMGLFGLVIFFRIWDIEEFEDVI